MSHVFELSLKIRLCLVHSVGMYNFKIKGGA